MGNNSSYVDNFTEDGDEKVEISLEKKEERLKGLVLFLLPCVL